VPLDRGTTRVSVWLWAFGANVSFRSNATHPLDRHVLDREATDRGLALGDGLDNNIRGFKIDGAR
jgi:hypothetical protein